MAYNKNVNKRTYVLVIWRKKQMTVQQAKDFGKWLSCELDAYMDDHNIGTLTDVPLEIAVEEAEYAKSNAWQWLQELDPVYDDAEYDFQKERYQGAVKFLKKYGKR